ncbi:hypothetical protein GALMADRAFT_419203 [Galerina marginata CBS 339.88]|uniref:NACHT domain-containing protein n=1 Tax=Galerina marginata (strain CBS 339.88) TaxID=685588 RepID=A0A067T1B8_GALM3|nr:hypothetical protein GALMADRAFT_419203 [Galerina marginata CBS 339.88]
MITRASVRIRYPRNSAGPNRPSKTQKVDRILRFGASKTQETDTDLTIFWPQKRKFADTSLWELPGSSLHNSEEVSDQPKCHPGTRVAILDHLIAWATALTFAFPIVWLHGPAGAGKSAILRTIAHALSARTNLLASFFFFRASPGRNSSDSLIATIAYQLTKTIPATRRHIVEAIENDPLIFSLSLWDQAQALIVSPLIIASNDTSWNPGQFPRVIVIDGLDECHYPNRQADILKVMCRIIQSLPIPFAVLIASRPEHHIRSEFNCGDLNRMSSRLALDESYNPDADIKLYLTDRFRAIQESYPFKSHIPKSPPWPSPEIIDQLVAKASGQFIYVSTVDKFVSSSRHNPVKRLDIILGTISAGNLKPFEQLDKLYSVIFSTVESEALPATLRILGVLLVPLTWGSSRTPEFIERLLMLEPGDMRNLLFDLESLLTIDDQNKPVRVFHASLGDYLFDRSRSGQFYIDAGPVYADLAQHCTIHLHQKSWTALNQFFYSDALHFFSKATATSGLREAIESCDITKVVDFGGLWTEATGQYKADIAPTLLQAIRASAFPDAQELYLGQLRSYAAVIWPRIHFYFQNTAMKHLLIAASVGREASESFKSWEYKNLQCIFQVSRQLSESELIRGLNLEHSNIALLQITRDLFNDPNSEYFIDSNQYAAIALYLAEFMARNPDKIRSQYGAGYVESCMSGIFPPVLSRASLRPDLLDRLKNTVPDPSYTDPSIADAMTAYISRFEAQSMAPILVQVFPNDMPLSLTYLSR